MAIKIGINNKRRGAIIALRKAQRAKEMMQAFRRASINPPKNSRL